MLAQWLIVVALLVALMWGWIAVQRAARRFAEQHPETGAFREIGRGCGGGGGCGGKCASGSKRRCDRPQHAHDA